MTGLLAAVAIVAALAVMLLVEKAKHDAAIKDMAVAHMRHAAEVYSELFEARTEAVEHLATVRMLLDELDRARVAQAFWEQVR